LTTVDDDGETFVIQLQVASEELLVIAAGVERRKRWGRRSARRR
jgi:hypothetical protein